MISSEHEGVDDDSAAPAVRHLVQRTRDHIAIESHRVLVDAAIGQGQRARLSIGNHHDLPHVLFLVHQYAARQLQSFGRVGVVRSNLRLCERGEWNLLGGVVEEHDADGVAGKLRANQMREREGDLLGGSKPVFAVENHRMGAVEHQHRRAGRAVLCLTNHQVRVIQIERDIERSGPHECVPQRVRSIEVEGVAEFVRPAPRIRLDAGGEVWRVVTAEAALS